MTAIYILAGITGGLAFAFLVGWLIWRRLKGDAAVIADEAGKELRGR
jgi:hypothetical protein